MTAFARHIKCCRSGDESDDGGRTMNTIDQSRNIDLIHPDDQPQKKKNLGRFPFIHSTS